MHLLRYLGIAGYKYQLKDCVTVSPNGKFGGDQRKEGFQISMIKLDLTQEKCKDPRTIAPHIDYSGAVSMPSSYLNLHINMHDVRPMCIINIRDASVNG